MNLHVASTARILLERLLRLFWLKAAGTSLFMWVFFHLYFQIQRSPQYAVVDVPLTWLDREFPMQAWAWVPYLSLWLFTSLPPALQPDLRSLLYYGASIFGVCAMGLLFFYFWPTRTAGLIAPAEQGLAWLKGIDLAGNACPSLHVASAVFSWSWLRHQLRQVGAGPRWHMAVLVWGLTIVVSTMLTKQHAFWDVLAGVLLGAAGAGGSLLTLESPLVRRYLCRTDGAANGQLRM